MTATPTITCKWIKGTIRPLCRRTSCGPQVQILLMWLWDHWLCRLEVWIFPKARLQATEVSNLPGKCQNFQTKHIFWRKNNGTSGKDWIHVDSWFGCFLITTSSFFPFNTPEMFGWIQSWEDPKVSPKCLGVPPWKLTWLAGKCPFSLGNTSTHSWGFSNVMCFFQGCKTWTKRPNGYTTSDNCGRQTLTKSIWVAFTATTATPKSPGQMSLERPKKGKGSVLIFDRKINLRYLWSPWSNHQIKIGKTMEYYDLY